MKIAIILNSLVAAGAETHSLQVAQMLEARGCSVLLIVLRNAPAAAELDTGGLKRLTAPPLGFRPLRGWLDASLEANKIDAVVSVNLKPTVSALLLSRKRRHISVNHSFPRLVLSGGIVHSAKAVALLMMAAGLQVFGRNRIDTCIYVSARQRAAWRFLPPFAITKSRIIPNGVQTQPFQPAPDLQLPAEPDMLKVAMVAAFRVEKNHALLVDAIEEMHRQGIRVHVVFAGDGPLRPQVQTAIMERGLSSLFTFTGVLANVRAVYEWADVTALPSRMETSPLAVLESMSYGTPVVASDVGGVGEQVDSGKTGILFRSGDIDGLVSALKLMSDPKIRLSFGRAAAKSVKDQFSQGAMHAAYFNCIARAET